MSKNNDNLSPYEIFSSKSIIKYFSFLNIINFIFNLYLFSSFINEKHSLFNIFISSYISLILYGIKASICN